MSRIRLDENPFDVLGLTSEAGRADIERAGPKLLALLALGHSSVAEYPTPLGPRPRSESLVRAAMAALRDPAARLLAELAWLPPGPGSPAVEAPPLPRLDLRRRTPCFP